MTTAQAAVLWVVIAIPVAFIVVWWMAGREPVDPPIPQRQPIACPSCRAAILPRALYEETELYGWACPRCRHRWPAVHHLTDFADYDRRNRRAA